MKTFCHYKATCDKTHGMFNKKKLSCYIRTMIGALVTTTCDVIIKEVPSNKTKFKIKKKKMRNRQKNLGKEKSELKPMCVCGVDAFTVLQGFSCRLDFVQCALNYFLLTVCLPYGLLLTSASMRQLTAHPYLFCCCH